MIYLLAINKSPQKNKFRVHSIYTIEKVGDSSASTNVGTEADHITADIGEIISQKQKSVKRKLSDRDSSGRKLTEAQAGFFKDSKARDKDGNLLVLFHGTTVAGFTSFDPSRGRYGGNWFTTSRMDADSYAGNYKHKLFDPAEEDDIRTSVGGNFTLNSEMKFDSAEDLEKFRKDNPGAESYLFKIIFF